MHWIYHAIQHLLVSWKYWAVLLALLGEDAGMPIPGETVLMFASFMAHKNSGIHLPWLILVGTGAAVAGDNIGFFLGRHFGRTILRWSKKLFRLDDNDIKAARDLIRRHGGRTIFFSRFIFGLRTVAGPLAGSLDMEWRKFLKFNILGAASWVTAIVFTGYAFANAFQTLLGYMEKASWAIAVGIFLTGYFVWRRHKHQFEARQERKAA